MPRLSARVLAGGASAITVVVGCAVLAGAALDAGWLESFPPGTLETKANTALALVLAGLSLWFARARGRGPAVRMAAGLCACGVVVLGALTLVEYASGRDLGVDHLLAGELAATTGAYPGRMGPNTAVALVAIGLALLLLDVETRRGWRPAELLAAPTAVIALAALIGHTYGVTPLYGLSVQNGMTVPTALTLILLEVGVFAARPHSGMMAWATGDDIASAMLRRLLPATVAIPIILGVLRLAGERKGLYGAASGTATFVLATIVLMVAVVLASGRYLRGADRRRQRAEAGLRQAHGELEGRVEERTAALRRASVAQTAQAEQLRRLAEVSVVINSSRSVDAILETITADARTIIGTHQSVTSLTVNENWAQAITSVSLSEKYAAWRTYDAKPDGSGIYALVCRMNAPIRMTQAELEAHPWWRAFGLEAGRHPPMRGWLAAPLVGRDGRNLGLVQLSDKHEGEFTASDEAMLVQLAQMASVAIENAQLLEREQAARSEAECANRAKDEFLSVVSHELRTPLTPILIWARLLRQGKLPSDTTGRALETIERSAEAQAKLVEDLLDVSRMITGKLRLDMRQVDLGSVVAAGVETVRPAADAKGIALGLALDPGAGPIAGDPDRLQQVVWNLLSNAVKFTPEGGRVEVALEQTGPYGRLRVTDTGQGIASAFLPYVFDRFRQADSSSTRAHGGLGIGLALVRHLVELHGGTVEVSSAGPGTGATFTVTLPLAVERTADGHRPPRGGDAGARPDAGALRGLRVLVVDDQEDAREALRVILGQAGIAVTVAASSAEALAALERARPDVILSDLGMPNEDGYALIRRIRDRAPEDGGRIPAAAVTAYTGREERARSLAAGFDAHVAKPIDPDGLLAVVADLARRAA